MYALIVRKMKCHLGNSPLCGPHPTDTSRTTPYEDIGEHLIKSPNMYLADMAVMSEVQAMCWKICV